METSRLPSAADYDMVGSMKSFLISLIAGVVIWGSILLVAIAYQPTHAGSVVASIEIGLALVLTVVACVLLRLR